MFNNPLTERKRSGVESGLTAHSTPKAQSAHAGGVRRFKYLEPTELSGLKNLLFAARTIVEGYYAGRHQSPFKGSAPEFEDYREYYPGDDLRDVDWKVLARTDRYFVKLYQRETDMNCALFLDASGSMGFRGITPPARGKNPALSKYEYGAYLTAALAFLMVKQGDKASLTLFDDEIRQHVPNGGTFPHLYKVLRALERTEPRRETGLSAVLKKGHGLLRSRGLLIVISDLIDEPEEVFRALNLFVHRGFEVLLFQVMHPEELELPSFANANVVDLETDARISCNLTDLKTAYQKHFREFLDAVRAYSVARGIEYNLVSTSTPYHVALEKYLMRRGRT
jgi:uncharacterized protein (DUF58 family)